MSYQKASYGRRGLIWLLSPGYSPSQQGIQCGESMKQSVASTFKSGERKACVLTTQPGFATLMQIRAPNPEDEAVRFESETSHISYGHQDSSRDVVAC